MPTIEITREQLAYIQALREELEDEVPYGQVRNLDAVQYLIDHHREDGDLDVEIEGDLDAEPEPEEAADGGTPGAVDVDADGGVDADASSDPTTDAESEDATTSPPTPDPNPLAAGGGGGGGDGTSDATTTRVSGGPDPSALSGSGGDDTLNEMMQLLETHDDKWDEASSGDAKYTVELPDGDSEPAGTKDDVRALLFKHYR